MDDFLLPLHKNLIPPHSSVWDECGSEGGEGGNYTMVILVIKPALELKLMFILLQDERRTTNQSSSKENNC